MFIYTLPTTHRGATHINFYELLVGPGAGVKLTGRYGRENDEGSFEADEELAQPIRTVEGREHRALLKATAAQGAPFGHWRTGDLEDWMDAWGFTGNGEAWAEANPEPMREPAATDEEV